MKVSKEIPKHAQYFVGIQNRLDMYREPCPKSFDIHRLQNGNFQINIAGVVREFHPDDIDEMNFDVYVWSEQS